MMLFARCLLSRVLSLNFFYLEAHAQNRVAKRKHRHLLDTAHPLMIVSSVPPHFWAEDVSTIIYFINIQPSLSLQGGIPFERLCGKTPDYSRLRHFWLCVLCASYTS
jgi:hypothetical protein